LSVALGKSAGERFAAHQSEFREWKIKAEMWGHQEEGRAEQKEYRRKRREERERRGGKVGRKTSAPKMEGKKESPPQGIAKLPPIYEKHLRALLNYIEREGPVDSTAAFSAMGIGKSQGYKILSAAKSAGILEKSGKIWRRRDGNSD